MRRAGLAVALAACAGCSEAPTPAPAPPREPPGPFEVVLPEETADATALERFAELGAWPTLGATVRRQQTSRDRGTGGPPPVELVANGNRDMNHFVCRSADAVAGEFQVIPYVFDLPECPDPGVRGLVLSRFEGSGELVRLWLTAVSLQARAFDEEMLRIYVDDTTIPALQVPLASVVDGSAGELFAPPFGLGAPDRVAWRYPVAFSRKLVVAVDGLDALDLFYHQTDVLLDAAPRRAARERLPVRDAARDALLGQDGGTPLMAPVPVTLAPGETRTVIELLGPRTVRSVSITADGGPADLEGVHLRVWFDDALTIDVPLLELFAAGLAPPEPASLALGPGLTLRLPMPFATATRWELASGAPTEVSLTLAVTGTDGVPAGAFGRLHVERHETAGPTATATHPLARSTGPGRLAGVCLMAEGHALAAGGLADPFNFLEGDERATVDGDIALDGTGTEDYFDSAFYYAGGAFATPFAQAFGLQSDGTTGAVTTCRWHAFNDRIDFQDELAFDLEIGPARPDLLDRYRTVAFVYR